MDKNMENEMEISGLGSRDITLVMENHMEKKMENFMETGGDIDTEGT